MMDHIEASAWEQAHIIYW